MNKITPNFIPGKNPKKKKKQWILWLSKKREWNDLTLIAFARKERKDIDARNTEGRRRGADPGHGFGASKWVVGLELAQYTRINKNKFLIKWKAQQIYPKLITKNILVFYFYFDNFLAFFFFL